ncbi:hypothetical protein [Aquiflexum lacus]|nr:hypothetical protein [Aquiflexum lacus]
MTEFRSVMLIVVKACPVPIATGLGASHEVRKKDDFDQKGKIFFQ